MNLPTNLPSKWAEKRERPKFTDRLGLAQPLLAAAALTLITLALGLPILYLLNTALTPDVAPSGLMEQFRLGTLYTQAAAWMDGPLATLVNEGWGPGTGGVIGGCLSLFPADLGHCHDAAQPMAHAITSDGGGIVFTPYARRYVNPDCGTCILLVGSVGGPGAQSAQAALVLLMHIGFSFFLLLSWYGGLSGHFFSWRALIIDAAGVAVVLTLFTWVIGALLPEGLDADPSGFTRAAFLLGHLMGFWLIIVLGVHFLARQTLAHSDWQDLDELTRDSRLILPWPL